MKPRDFQKLVERMRGTPEEKPIAFLMLRTMQKARYDPSNMGHFGLAASSYTHFTSPIRRYPDLIVHRTLRETRHGRMTEDRAAELTEDLPEIARHTSERERRADDAERELVQWKKVRFMKDKVGDEFDGYITGVSAFGLYIELIEHFVEGMVHISTMADDYYRFVEKAHVLKGENTGKIYRLGDRVTVQVVKVDMERRQIDLGHGRDPRPGARVGSESRAAPEQGGAAIGARPRAPEGRDGRGARGPSGRAGRNGPRSGSDEPGDPWSSARPATSITARARWSARSPAPIRIGSRRNRPAASPSISASRTPRSTGITLSFVDVPGHERFVKNMLAGAGGIDLVMLVIAADESVMPQTREHFDICRLLRVSAGLIALTKIDLADPDLQTLADARSAGADRRILSRRGARRRCLGPNRGGTRRAARGAGRRRCPGAGPPHRAGHAPAD